MTVATVILLLLMAICGLAALLFLIRGLRLRSGQAQYAYGVGQQEARHEMQVNFLRAGFLLFLMLILLGIVGLVPGAGESASEATATLAPTAGQTTSTVAPTTAVEQEVTSTAAPTDEAPTLTATVAPTMTATAPATEAPIVATVVVNSPNGLWLREAPGGTQEVELIAHETVLELLTGRETADDIEWQQVRTPAGNEGWVAAEFLIAQ